MGIWYKLNLISKDPRAPAAPRPSSPSMPEMEASGPLATWDVAAASVIYDNAVALNRSGDLTVVNGSIVGRDTKVVWPPSRLLRRRTLLVHPILVYSREAFYRN
jgi:hypothetical protein